MKTVHKEEYEGHTITIVKGNKCYLGYINGKRATGFYDNKKICLAVTKEMIEG